jgi:hypothetical protein
MRFTMREGVYVYTKTFSCDLRHTQDKDSRGVDNLTVIVVFT